MRTPRKHQVDLIDKYIDLVDKVQTLDSLNRREMYKGTDFNIPLVLCNSNNHQMAQ